MKPFLIYIGNGASLPNVPARDLTREDADDLVVKPEKFTVQDLLKSGLYTQAEKEEPKKKQTKEGE